MACSGTSSGHSKSLKAQSRFQEHFGQRCTDFPGNPIDSQFISGEQEVKKQVKLSNNGTLLSVHSLPNMKDNHLVAIDTNSTSSTADEPLQIENVSTYNKTTPSCSLKRRNHIRRKKRYSPSGLRRKLSTTSSSSSKSIILEILHSKQSPAVQ